MNVLSLILLGSLTLAAVETRAKDGHRDASSDTTVKSTPSAWQSHTYYSYSYKPPGSSTPKSSSVRVSDYMHKADSVAQAYHQPTPSSRVSSSSLATQQKVNTARALLATALTQLKK